MTSADDWGAGPRPRAGEKQPKGGKQVTDVATRILEARYLQPGETPDAMCDRVAGALAGDNEAKVREWADMMRKRLFLPNSPMLMNAGTGLGQLAACFVLPIEDDLGAIYDTVKAMALVHQSGGGTGFDFSQLRPEGDSVRSTGGVASGPVAFMRVFNTAAEAVKQGGKRRGANMAVLRVDHPDIEQFIQCKAGTETELTCFNVSVGLTDEFVRAAREGGEYNLVNPRTREVVGTKNASEILDLIVHHAWANGEPGVLFLDAIERANPTPDLGRLNATNPCGEQPLLPYEACVLGSINLAAMYDHVSGCVDWALLDQTVWSAIELLDRSIDVGAYPLPEIEAAVKRTRKVGLGVMGLADLLILMGLPYDSWEGIELAEVIMARIQSAAHAASAQLGAEHGPYPAWGPGQGVLRRNATVTTIAPTGTLAMVAGCSSGCEPIFGVAFAKNVLGDESLYQVDAAFSHVMESRGLPVTDELLGCIAANGGSVQGLAEVPKDVQRLCRTALEIDWVWHVRMQAALQKHTDNAVSKTINLPNDATEADVRSAILFAYDEGCKGLTVYRAGSRAIEVIDRGVAPNAVSVAPAVAPNDVPVPRPDVLLGVTRRSRTPLGTLWTTVNTLGGWPFEMFCQIGSAGSDVGAFTEAIARLISLALRCGVDPRQIVGQLRGISGPGQVGFGPEAVRSVPEAIARALEAEIPSSEPGAAALQCDLCPSCGAYTLIRDSGCKHCESCGYSAC